jgi:FlaA1/EpsC-like NDP-sugar epimerase
MHSRRRAIRIFVWTVDVLGFMAATSVAWALAPSPTSTDASLLTLAAAAVAMAFAGFGTGLHRGRWAIGSFDETTAIGVAAIFATGSLGGMTALANDDPSLARLAIVGLGGAAIMGIARSLIRRRTSHDMRPVPGSTATAIVFGAGTGGELAVRAMTRDHASPYLPGVILDDDIDKHRMRIDGVPVLGGRDQMQRAIDATGATIMIIAVPSADGALISELFDLGHAHRLEVRVLPPASDLFGRQVKIADIRELRESDLLGRHRIETDVNSIADYLSGKRVLITGAGGSIGSELSRQVHRYGPSKLFLLDRDESALHAVQLSIHGRAMLDDDELVLANIRERDRMREVFEQTRPDVVFHGAALKHLPILERFPSEALQTNVHATVHLLDMAKEFGVTHFINVSSDKAADPISVLGYTKRLSERLTAWMDAEANGRYVSVRFGNVLGSRGSVLTAFHQQVLSGQPLTVTHPEVSRYFMTVEEAVELVIQAGAIGTGGEVLVLDMGQPVKILDVARRLAAQAGAEANIVYTGMRPGEKLTEDLFAAGEEQHRTRHELINSAPVAGIDPLMVLQVSPLERPDDLRMALIALCAIDDPTIAIALDAAEPTTSVDLAGHQPSGLPVA